MRRFCLVAMLAVAATGAAGCGDNSSRVTGAAGSGGSSAGSLGTAGAGGGATGANGGAAGVGAAGTGNAATGTGGTFAQSPQEIHDGLINAQTTGGLDVTRPQPSVVPPVCQ